MESFDDLKERVLGLREAAKKGGRTHVGVFYLTAEDTVYDHPFLLCVANGNRPVRPDQLRGQWQELVRWCQDNHGYGLSCHAVVRANQLVGLEIRYQKPEAAQLRLLRT